MFFLLFWPVFYRCPESNDLSENSVRKVTFCPEIQHCQYPNWFFFKFSPDVLSFKKKREWTLGRLNSSSWESIQNNAFIRKYCYVELYLVLCPARTAHTFFPVFIKKNDGHRPNKKIDTRCNELKIYFFLEWICSEIMRAVSDGAQH